MHRPRFEGNGFLVSVSGLVCLGVLTLLVAGAGPASPAGGVDVQVLESTGDRILVEYEVGEFGQVTVPLEGEKYTKLVLGRESPLKMKGAPELPNICRSVIIPNDARMVARIVASEYHDVRDVLIVPSKGVLSRKENPADVPYEFGEQYGVDAFFPGELASLREPYILRDYRGVVVEVNPFQYNPVTRVLRVYTKVTVEVLRSRQEGLVNLKHRPFRPDDVSLAFHGIYKHHFLNYPSESRYTPLDETGDMLIICHDAWLTNVQPLVDHRNSVGINAHAVGVSTVGNNAASIANYIQNEYNTTDLAFVLLVGDAGEVASPQVTVGFETESADPTYALVAGSDNYPDILVGRFSAQSAADVDTQVLRTIEYEQLPATTQAWFNRGTGIGSDEGTGDDNEYDWEHIDNIRTDLLGYGYTQVDQIYDPGASASQVSSALNAGRGIVNYCGHGSVTAWSTTGFSNSNVNTLVNNNELPFIVSVACNNGTYDGYTCFAEAWMRATNGAEPTGAIGVYASSVSQHWDPPMCAQDETVDLLVAEAYFSFGALCFAGSCQMMDEYGTSGREMFDTWHVFGDPAVRVYGTSAEPTCDDGIQNQGEDRIDCGGPCPACACVSDPACDDGTFCNGAETCDAYGECQVGSDPCSGYLGCDEGNDQCIECYGDGDCDDGLFCNGAETCSAGTCLAGSNPCPGQACDEINDICVAGPGVVYAWDMDSDPGWTTEGEWEWGTPTGGGGEYGNPDPTSGYTGSNVYGYNLNGDYAEDLAEQHLTTTIIDCTGLSDVALKFQRWLGVERSTYDRAYIRVSNGGGFTTVWANPDAHIEDSSWGLQEYDISSIADDQATVYIRWTMGTTDGSWQFCGWNIDDVEIWAIGGAEPTCDDGILNQGEERIDCGGPCPACDCTSDTTCSDGEFCNGAETCDVYGQCQPGSDPCAGFPECDEVNDVCIECYVNGDCDDGLFCTGVETCVGGVCQAGSDPCPGQACNEGTDQCEPFPAKRTPAEYEDNEGMLITWNSFTSLLTDMTVAVTTNDPEAIVYVIVTGASQQSSATSTLSGAGADMDQVEFITYTTDTVWLRDYGPRFITDDGERAIVDHEYNRPRPNDNAFPAFLGSLWAEDVSEIPLTLGGGNHLTFSSGDAFVSDLALYENAGYSEQEVKDLFDDYYGADLTIYPRFPSSFDSTGHIDMWMMPVGDDEVLIGEYSSSTGSPYTITENAAADLTARGYTVHRTPGWQSFGTHYTYTNAVIMNDVVLVPWYNSASEDATALAMFQSVFADRTVVQIDCTSIIDYAGAMHCVMMHVPSGEVLATCSDGVLNQGEDRIDCGGPCPACSCLSDGVCADGLFCNGAETCDAYGECQAAGDACAPTQWCNEGADVCVLYGDGDFDGDGDVDLGDFRVFQVCYAQLAGGACEPGNMTGDGVIDLDDYAEFQGVLGGPE